MNPPKAAPSAWYLARSPSALGGWSSLQRTSWRRCRGKRPCIVSAQETQTRDGSRVPTLGACAAKTTGPGKRRSVFWPFRTLAPPWGCGPPQPPCHFSSTQGDAGSNLLTLRSRCKKNRVGPWATGCLPACHLLETLPGVQLCLRGRGSGHSARDTGRLGSGCGSIWLPAVTAGLGQQVSLQVRAWDGGGRVTGSCFIPFLGLPQQVSTVWALEISAVCSLPARRLEVHSQECGQSRGFSRGVGRMLPAPPGLSCLASVSPWSLPPSSPHSGPLPGAPASTFLSSWKDTPVAG